MVPVVAPHEVERVALDAGGRDVLAQGHRRSVGGVGHGQEQPLVPGVEQASQRHREAALHLALTALGHEPPQPLSQLGAHGGGVVEGAGVAVAGDAVDRLAEALVAPALEREPADVDDALVARVHVVHAGRAVHRQPVLPGPQHRQGPSVLVGEPSEAPPDLPALRLRADRVRGHQADPAVHGIGDGAVGPEPPLLVGPQREVVESPGRVALDDVASLFEARAGLRTEVQGAALHHRPEREPQGEGGQAQGDGHQRRRQEVVEAMGKGDGVHAHQTLGHRGGGPGQRQPRRVPGGGHELHGAGSQGGDHRHPAGQRQQADTPRRPVHGGAEGAAVVQEEHGHRCAHHRLLQVTTLHEVEQDRTGEQGDRHRPRLALAPAHAP